MDQSHRSLNNTSPDKIKRKYGHSSADACKQTNKQIENIGKKLYPDSKQYTKLDLNSQSEMKLDPVTINECGYKHWVMEKCVVNPDPDPKPAKKYLKR